MKGYKTQLVFRQSDAYNNNVSYLDSDSFPDAAVFTSTVKGIILHADSESLAQNIELEEGADKLLGDRSITKTDVIRRSANPGGEITWQPRPDDAFIAFGINFHAGTFIGTLLGTTGTQVGTYIFVPHRVGIDPDAVSQDTASGGTWSPGTASGVAYIALTKQFEGAVGTNAFQYLGAVADNLTLSAAFGEDVKLSMDVMAKTVTATYLQSSAFGENTFQYYSRAKRFTDWHATFTVDGTDYGVTSVEMRFQNQQENRGKLGHFGFSHFTQGKILHEGEFVLELEDFSKFPPEGTGTVHMRCFNEDGIIDIVQYNAVYRSWDPQASGGEALIEVTVPYRAVADKSNKYAETIVQVIGTFPYGVSDILSLLP